MSKQIICAPLSSSLHFFNYYRVVDIEQWIKVVAVSMVCSITAGLLFDIDWNLVETEYKALYW